MIDYVSEQVFRRRSRELEREAAGHDTKNYEDWLRLRSAITREVERYGRWNGQAKECDFYHGDDWFCSLTDGFALQTVSPLRKIQFSRLQQVVARHSQFGLLSI